MATIKRTTIFIAFSILLSLFAATSFANNKYTYLQGINIQYPDSSQSQVNVIISADKAFDYKSFKLAANKKANKSARYVLDALNSKPKFYIDEHFQRLFEKDEIIKLIRVGKNHKEYTRIVFDLKQPVNAQVTEQSSTSGGRLFIISFTPINQKSNTKEDSQELSTLITPEGSKQISVEQAEQVASQNNGNDSISTKDPFTVVIDPGHGGRDSGSISPDGTIKEKNINYSVARKLKRIIDKDSKFRAFLTRDSDIQYSLGKRIKTSHKKAADIFISIHVDSFVGSSNIKGSSVFILADKEVSNQLARLLAKRENEVDEKYGLENVNTIKNKDTQFIVRDLQRKSIDNASEKLAISVIKEIGKVKELFSPIPRKGPFAVLKSSYIPSILIELGYITNPAEAKLLVNNLEQDKIAKAIYLGIRNYAENNLKTGQTKVLRKQASTSQIIKKEKSNTLSKKKLNQKIKKITAKKIKPSKKIPKQNKVVVNKPNSDQKISKIKIEKASKKVSKPKQIIYTVQAKDTFESIARDHNVSTEIIKKMNPKYQDLIFSGDRLVIPSVPKQ